MSSVRLSEIPRTISFRTGLLFLGLFGCSFLALFGYIYWQTAFYLKTEADTALYRQVENRSAQDPELRLHEMRKHVAQDVEARLPHSLFDANGQFIAGAIRQLPPYTALDKPQEFRWLKANGHHRPVRFIVHRLEDGKLLLVAQDVHDIREFDELLINALISGGLLLLLVGLAGAVVLGYSAHRRLDKVSRSIKGIIEGDLTGRLPVRGNNDDIDRLALVVNGMLDELERLMSEVKGVCDDIAHDLRTPLTRSIISPTATGNTGRGKPALEHSVSITASSVSERAASFCPRAMDCTPERMISATYAPVNSDSAAIPANSRDRLSTVPIKK